MAKAKKQAVPAAYTAVTGGARHRLPAKVISLVGGGVAVLILIVAAMALVAVHHTDKKDATATTKKVALPDNTSPAADTEQQNLVKDGATAVTNSVLTTHSFASIGQYLADPAGATLYTYGKDTTGVSNCNASCAANWPIYSADTAATPLPADVSIVTSSDGKKQYTYKGRPLYYYTVDQQSGGVNGDGLNGFYIAKP